MKKILTSLFVVATLCRPLVAEVFNAADLIPCVIPSQGWQRVPDVAHYKHADWSNVVGRAEGIDIERAKAVANSDPAITYFFWVKGGRLVLEDTRNPHDPIYRIFFHGDAIYFTGEPCWGSATDLADGYIKE